MKLQDKAQKYIDQFEIIKIQDTDETRAILKDTASKKLRDSVREAHGERFPNDFIFATYLSILERITECESQDLEDIRSEIVDSMVDIYTSDLTAWLASDIYNLFYLDEAIENGATDGNSLLSMAQYTAIDELYPFVQELLNNL